MDDIVAVVVCAGLFVAFALVTRRLGGGAGCSGCEEADAPSGCQSCVKPSLRRGRESER